MYTYQTVTFSFAVDFLYSGCCCKAAVLILRPIDPFIVLRKTPLVPGTPLLDSLLNGAAFSSLLLIAETYFLVTSWNVYAKNLFAFSLSL